MVAFERDIETFFTKSAQLIEVFPTARCTTKYRKLNDSQAFITVKTYDPASGSIVKFRTDKTVDLGRLLVGSTKLSAALVGRASLDNDNKGTGTDVEMIENDVTETTRLKDDQEVPVASVPVTSTSTGSKKKKKKGGKK